MILTIIVDTDEARPASLEVPHERDHYSYRETALDAALEGIMRWAENQQGAEKFEPDIVADCYDGSYLIGTATLVG